MTRQEMAVKFVSDMLRAGYATEANVNIEMSRIHANCLATLAYALADAILEKARMP